MSYYKMLLVIFVILILSVLVQGSELFKDTFFAAAYAIMGLVLFIGTKFEQRPRTAILLGLILIFSVGFLSTHALVEFFSGQPTVTMIFKMAIVFSLDACALYFLNYGRKYWKEETRHKRLGQIVTGKAPYE
jgi:hypothetical protein